MSSDELWKLHESVVTKLTAELTRQKILLEDRLKQLTPQTQTESQGKRFGRRSYPKVSPKFRNPDQPSETWAGRGKQPHWLAAQLRSGKRIDDFRIEHAA
jgi:DNA-binding protein H-NS